MNNKILVTIKFNFMKKLTFLISGLLLFVFVSNAQPIEEGDFQVNAGVGFSTYGLPIYAGGEYGIAENISVGGVFSFRKYSVFSNYSPSIITIAAIGNYHVNELLEIPPEWDIYGGLSLGYSIWSGNRVFGYTGRASRPFFSAQVGGRYFFSDNIAINVEFGGGTYSGGKVGVTFVI